MVETRFINQGDGYNVIIPGNNNTINMGSIIPKVRCCNLEPLPQITPRKECVKTFFKAICNNKYVNLYGIGGLGKSSLVRVCVFDPEYENQFGSVVNIPVENNIESDCIETIMSDPHFYGLGLEVVDDNKRKSKQKDVSDVFKEIMVKLQEKKSIDNSFNLLIFDVNDDPSDDKGLKSFIGKVKSGCSGLPFGWKILFVTHSVCDVDCQVTLPDVDTEFVERLYKDKKGIDLDAETKNFIFSTLFYNPLLISVVAGIMTCDTEVQRIFKIVQKLKAQRAGQSDDKQQDVKDYLNGLVRFEILGHNQKLLVLLFMLWPAKDIPFKVLCSFLHGYTFMFKRGKVRLGHEDDFGVRSYEKYVLNKDDIDEFEGELLKLANCNLLVHNKEHNSYQMHSMIADVLRGQYCKFLQQWNSFMWRWKRMDHSDYIRRAEYMMKLIHDEKKSDSNRNVYIDCIVLSIDKIKRFDPKCGQMTELSNLMEYPEIRLYNKEQELKSEIEKTSITDNVGLFNRYIELGDLYDVEYSNRSSANDFYKKAIDCYDPEVVSDHNTYVNLCLKYAESFYLPSLEYYKKAIAIYRDNKIECKLDAFHEKLFDWLPDDFTEMEVNDSTLADFYYRLGRFYENYYWEIEQDSTKIFNAKKFFKAADDIWSSPSFPQETEGDLKGFIKTSYGIYDPIYGFKLVKVEKGCFDMGIKESDSGYSVYSEMLEKTKRVLFFMEKLKTTEDVGLVDSKYFLSLLEGEGYCHQRIIEEDFYIGMYPVTKAQWKKCADIFTLPYFDEMEIDGIESLRQQNNSPEKTPIEIGGRGNDCPMNYVSAYDADNFIKQLNTAGRRYSLPTEVQWEYAARGGNNNSRTKYSGSDDIEKVANYGGKITGNSDTMYIGAGPVPVGSLQPNALGIYDMSGNVWEWCQDWYNSEWYKIGGDDVCPEDQAEVVNFIHDKYSYSGASRVLRGGSWLLDADECRVSLRNNSAPDYRYHVYGFRLSLSFAKHNKKEN